MGFLMELSTKLLEMETLFLFQLTHSVPNKLLKKSLRMIVESEDGVQR